MKRPRKIRDETDGGGKNSVERATPLDAALTFARQKNVSSWARELRVSRHNALVLLQEAFESGIVSLPAFPDYRVRRELEARFPETRFSIIGARLCFAELCAKQIFQWIVELVGEWEKRVPNVKVCIAIGGGRGMEMVCKSIDGVLQQDTTVRDWFRVQREKRALQFVNATVGGQPKLPQQDSSYLTVYFANHCEGQQVGIFSLAEELVNDEEELLKTVNENPAIIISGIGAPNGAYCLTAMKNAKLFSDKLRERFLGEFLYHPILENGALLFEDSEVSNDDKLEDRLLIKENIHFRDNAGGKFAGRSEKPPIFASLFSVKKLRHWNSSGGKAERKVVGVIHDTNENRNSKARLLTEMLRCRYFSHIVMSTELGNAVVNETLSLERR